MSDFSFASLLVADALIAAGVIVGALIFAYTVGRYSLVPMITALGIGAAFASLAPYVGNIPGMMSLPEFQQRIAVFVVVTIVGYVIFRRHSYFEPSVVPNGVELVVCGLLMAGFALAVVGAFLPPDLLATISPHLRLIFGNAWAQTLWFAAPILVFGAMRGR